MSVFNELSLDSAMDDGNSKYMLDGNWSFVFVFIPMFDLTNGTFLKEQEMSNLI